MTLKELDYILTYECSVRLYSYGTLVYDGTPVHIPRKYRTREIETIYPAHESILTIRLEDEPTHNEEYTFER